jgi:hypothetical protein
VSLVITMSSEFPTSDPTDAIDAVGFGLLGVPLVVGGVGRRAGTTKPPGKAKYGL